VGALKLGSPGAFYLKYISSGRFLSSTGPLWFAVALLILCLLLAGSRLVWRRPTVDERDESASQGAPGTTVAAPGVSFLWTIAFALGLITFAVRLIQPIGTSVLNMQFCFFPQYIAFFACGLHAARYGWLLPLAASSVARAAGWISLWEQFAGVGLSLGALAFFSRKLDFENALMRWLAERSFAVYVLHAPVLVGLAMLFRALPQNMYGLAALLTATGLLGSYIVADFARRLPVFRTFL
jgi:glucan biosynthesis protein C